LSAHTYIPAQADCDRITSLEESLEQVCQLFLGDFAKVAFNFTDLLFTFAYRWSYLVGIEDINSSRNGLLLFRPIEWSFDNSRAMFVRDPMGNWVYNLLDQGLCNVQLIDKFIELESASSDPSKVREVGASVNCYRFSFCVWCMSL